MLLQVTCPHATCIVYCEDTIEVVELGGVGAWTEQQDEGQGTCSRVGVNANTAGWGQGTCRRIA